MTEGSALNLVNNASNNLKGIKGWLILLAIAMVVGPLRLAGEIAKSLQAPPVENFQDIIMGEIFFQMALLIYATYISYLFFRKSRMFPGSFIVFGITCMLFLPLDLLVTSIFASSRFNMGIGQIFASADLSKEIGGWVGALISFTIWIAYVKRSRRVANTFVE